MKAMILAAGRGERMRPLTDVCPKPMLKVAGVPLIEHHIKKLAAAGITDIVINHAWLGHVIEDYLQDGSQWGVSITYSRETEGALETAGGIIKAMPLLLDETNKSEPFLVVNGDVYTDFSFDDIPTLPLNCFAHIWLIANPEHNKKGDFCVMNDQLINIASQKAVEEALQSFTFSGIGLYRPEFFMQHLSNEILPLGPLLRHYADVSKVSACVMSSTWIDVGTPERLKALNEQVLSSK